MLNMPAFLLREKMIIKKLAQCGATSENSAKTLAEAELDRQMVVKAITPTKDSNVN